MSDFTLKYARSPHYRVVVADSFNFQWLQLSGGPVVILTPLVDEIMTESESFPATVDSLTGTISQAGQRNLKQEPRRLEEVGIRATQKWRWTWR